MSDSQPPAPGPEWSTPLPASIPRPTFWPAALAYGITFLMWGIVTSMVLVVVGGLVFVAAIVGWIGELRLEQRRS
jgi:hypothetical protein